MVAVLGAGGHGSDVAAIVRATGETVEFYDDDPTHGFPPCTEPDGFLIGVYDPSTRAKMDRPAHYGYQAVHPSALVDPSVIAVDGLVVAAGAVLGNGVTLGPHVHVGQGSSLVRCDVGAYTTISPGAVICGDVKVGEAVLIGANATVANLCEIGDYSIIGAGAVLPPRTVVPRGSVWVGNPARPLREAA